MYSCISFWLCVLNAIKSWHEKNQETQSKSDHTLHKLVTIVPGLASLSNRTIVQKFQMIYAGIAKGDAHSSGHMAMSDFGRSLILIVYIRLFFPEFVM